MNESDGAAGGDRLRQFRPEQHLFDERRPPLKQCEANAKASGPCVESVRVKRGLLVAYHDDGCLADSHIDAFFAEYLHVGKKTFFEKLDGRGFRQVKLRGTRLFEGLKLRE